MVHVIIESRSIIIRPVVGLAPIFSRSILDANRQAAVAVLTSIR